MHFAASNWYRAGRRRFGTGFEILWPLR
jgi:hypothetical protein